MGQGVVIDEDGRIVNRNPATGEVVSHVPSSTRDELEHMIQTSSAAYPNWKTCINRMTLLRKAMGAVKDQEEELTSWMVQEMGKPLKEAKEEMTWALSRKNDFLDLLEESLQLQVHNNSMVVRDPFGVVVILSPWNFPVDELLLLALPSLASGNTVLVKPSEVVPETGKVLVETMASVLPPGVLQIAQGDGQKVGAFLVNHKDVALICMTGSSATGKTILQSATPQLKRVVLELGGKDPMIVFDDADLDKAAQDAVAYSLVNTGQVCCSVERIYVAPTIRAAFHEKVVELAKTYRVGNGMDPTTQVGPMVSHPQRAIVRQQVQNAIDQGATILYQSDIPTEKEQTSTEKEATTSGSSFFPVTVLANVTEEMKLLTEETFGPVVTLVDFDGSEDDAIRLANQTDYGLGSMVYTQDLEKAKRVASHIVAGQVGINCYPLDHMNVKCPWVGHKQSGFGFHSGVDGFHQFSIPKTIVFGD